MRVDLRSDTVTQPSAAMRRAMAEAEVGDDVYGEDPTVNRLQERVAELLGMEAALFVPTGTMANQIGIGIHTRPGDEVIAGRDSHNWLFETGAAAAINGVQHCMLPGDGRFDAAALRAAFKADDHHRPASRVCLIENTHNFGGGLVWDPDSQAEVSAAARELGLAVHLDGARLWNAAAALQRPAAELCRGCDTAAVCLSKGLGAPVGSLIAGSAEHIREAHRLRKRLGGGMRQAGVLAAAGLHALEHHREKLADDHRRARLLSAGLQRAGIEVAEPATNIVIARVRGSAAALTSAAADDGVLFYPLGPQSIRLVTHLDVTDADIERAVTVITRIATSQGET